ncbi:hypothetical protein Maes01_02624 [Microbulbifer aestuariivivens]|uniref:Uncharacterized protein n=1 Tax=Microbulbifer aestuariivivens TaxID=1908308 RepID=A0ABP9WSH4_9GAMM
MSDRAATLICRDHRRFRTRCNSRNTGGRHPTSTPIALRQRYCNGRIYAKLGGKLAGNTKKWSGALPALYFLGLHFLGLHFLELHFARAVFCPNAKH